MNNLSIYIHVPFCRKKCNYCDFYSAPPTPGAVSSYAQALCNQIRNTPQKGRAIYSVYFGGGTPSLLPEADFTAIAKTLYETFDLSSCQEFTVECNPESVTPSLAEAWKKSGVNRISMGIQTFSDLQLKTLGRLHDRVKALSSYEVLQQAGFDNISLDLMMALPGQTLDDLTDDLNQMISLNPRHLSVYLLKIEPNSVFGSVGVPESSDELQRECYLLAHKMLTEAGYEHYEISNFAKPGYRAKHNSAYWQGGEYLAFGPGASGFCDSVRYCIPSDTARFCTEMGMISPVLEEIVDGVECRKEAVFLGLRLADGISRSLIDQEKLPFIQQLCDLGYATLTDDRFSLTAEGFLISDYVIRELLPER